MPSSRRPSLNHTECLLVDQANFAQAEIVMWKFKLASLAGVRESAPMDAEAGGSVELAEQPQGDFVETPHAPSDALVVVDRVGSGSAGVGGQLVRHEAPGPPVME